MVQIFNDNKGNAVRFPLMFIWLLVPNFLPGGHQCCHVLTHLWHLSLIRRYFLCLHLSCPGSPLWSPSFHPSLLFFLSGVYPQPLFYLRRKLPWLRRLFFWGGYFWRESAVWKKFSSDLKCWYLATSLKDIFFLISLFFLRRRDRRRIGICLVTNIIEGCLPASHTS